MITNNKKYKDIKFLKVKSQIFNNVKQYNKNKSSNEMIFFHYSPSIKRVLRKSTRSSALCKLLKNVEEQYSILENKNNLFIPSKKVQSSNQINIFSKLFLGQKEKEKNIGKENIGIYLKHEVKKLKEKKDNSSKSMKMCKSLIINNNSKCKNNKLDENDKNISFITNNKSNKYKRIKIKENNKDKKYNDEIHDTKRKEKLGKTIKSKLLCCL